MNTQICYQIKNAVYLRGKKNSQIDGHVFFFVFFCALSRFRVRMEVDRLVIAGKSTAMLKSAVRELESGYQWWVCCQLTFRADGLVRTNIVVCLCPRREPWADQSGRQPVSVNVQHFPPYLQVNFNSTVCYNLSKYYQSWRCREWVCELILCIKH